MPLDAIIISSPGSTSLAESSSMKLQLDGETATIQYIRSLMNGCDSCEADRLAMEKHNWHHVPKLNGMVLFSYLSSQGYQCGLIDSLDGQVDQLRELLAQNPDFTMFDEPDSGVDIENVELLAEEINVLLDKQTKPGLRQKSGLLITHLGYILNFVAADTAHVLMDGRIACSGNPTEILEDIRKEGFHGCVECCKIH